MAAERVTDMEVWHLACMATRRVSRMVVMVPRRGRERGLPDVLGGSCTPRIAADGCQLPLRPGLTLLDGCASLWAPCLPSGGDAAAAGWGVVMRIRFLVVPLAVALAVAVSGVAGASSGNVRV